LSDVNSSNGPKILIDAIFSDVPGRYVGPSKSMLTQMINAVEPFNNIRLVLVTHSDSDHFNAEFSAKYLEKNTKTQLVAPQQVVTLLEKQPDFEKIKNQVIEVTPKRGGFDLIGETKRLTIGNIDIAVVGLRHVPYTRGGGPDAKINTQNNGYIINLDSVKIFHAGDALVSMNEGYFSSDLFKKEAINLFFEEAGKYSILPRLIERKTTNPIVIFNMHERPSKHAEKTTLIDKGKYKTVLWAKQLDFIDFTFDL